MGCGINLISSSLFEGSIFFSGEKNLSEKREVFFSGIVVHNPFIIPAISLEGWAPLDSHDILYFGPPVDG